jgi:hypothetical protein
MTNPVGATVGCLLVGEYVDEADRPEQSAATRGEVVRPQLVASFLDVGGSDDTLREFTVLLKDGRVIAVRGHGLKHAPHPVAGEDVYSIVVRSRGEEVLVALFKSADVAGIFHGDMRSERKIA